MQGVIKTEGLQDKCSFFWFIVEYSGHRIDQQGIHSTTQEVEAIIATKHKNLNELRAFSGLLNFYNKFVPMYFVTFTVSSWRKRCILYLV